MAVPERYKRNVQALSEEECNALAEKRVTVVGCGGLGGYCIENLARLGVGRIRVIDGDSFEVSNLNRQILATEANLGARKVQAAVERVKAVNSLVEVEAFDTLIDEGNTSDLIAGSDCVLDCLDNFEARFWLAHTCQQAGLPLVYGAIAGWFGQVCTVFPGDVSFVEVYGSVSEGAESQHLKLGNLPFTASTVGCIMASEATKVLIGRGELLRNRLMMIDLLDGSVEELPLK